MKFKVGDKVRIRTSASEFWNGFETAIVEVDARCCLLDAENHRRPDGINQNFLWPIDELELVEEVKDLGQYVKKSDVWKAVTQARDELYRCGYAYLLDEPLDKLGITPPKPKMVRVRHEFDVQEGLWLQVDGTRKLRTIGEVFGVNISNESVTEIASPEE